MRKFIADFGDAPVLLTVAHQAPTADVDRYNFPLTSATAKQNIH